MWAWVLAHLLLAWSWIASLTRRFFAAQSLRSRINYVLNLSLFAGVTAVILSGILIFAEGNSSIDGYKCAGHELALGHSSQSVLTVRLILTGLHLAINWDWVLAAGQKIFRRLREGAL